MRIIVSQTNDGSARLLLIGTFLLCLWSAKTIVGLKILRWMVAGISLSSGIILDFDGGGIALVRIGTGESRFAGPAKTNLAT